MLQDNKELVESCQSTTGVLRCTRVLSLQIPADQVRETHKSSNEDWLSTSLSVCSNFALTLPVEYHLCFVRYTAICFPAKDTQNIVIKMLAALQAAALSNKEKDLPTAQNTNCIQASCCIPNPTHPNSFTPSFSCLLGARLDNRVFKEHSRETKAQNIFGDAFIQYIQALTY